MRLCLSSFGAVVALLFLSPMFAAYPAGKKEYWIQRVNGKNVDG